VPINLEDLNKEQREGAVYGGGPLLILAGAGTGKTRVITYRIAHLIESGVPAERIMAVTFTNKAAAEMRERIERLAPGKGALVWVHTFHAFACRILRQHHGLLNLPRFFTIYDQDDQKRLVTQAMKELGLEDQKNKASMYVSIISRAKDDLLDAGSYSIYAMTSPDMSRQTAARIYAVYQKKLEAAGALDFGDLLLKTCELLKSQTEIREYYQDYFLHLLVDEYQDTNHAQYVLTKTLAAKHRNICVVGDDDQSVYSWRGANIRNILEFERDFGDAKVVTLEQNYRSTSLILDAATSVIKNNKERKAKTLWTQKEAGESVTVRELPNEMEEARWTISSLQGMVARGASLSDVAIFYRTNAQSRSFEEALRRSGLAYRIVGAMRFYERKEIKDILAYLRLALNPDDAAAFSRALGDRPRGIGKTSLDAAAVYAQEKGLSLLNAFRVQDQVPGLSAGARRGMSEMATLVDALKTNLPGLPPSQAIAQALQMSGYWEWLEKEVDTDPDAAGRMNNLQELMNAAKEYEEKAKASGEVVDVGRYLEGIALQSGIDDYDPSVPAVTLMTVHLAKGLEFPIVFLSGLEEGLFPIGGGNASPADLEEERRLCYVGITRARRTLFMTYASTRRMFGSVYANLPSRFIVEARLFSGTEGVVHHAPAVRPAPTAEGVPGTSRRAFVDGFRLGMRVKHPAFGLGRVVEKSGSGETVKVTVKFDNGRTTKLLVRYAPLEPA
jgi:DNA helicase II / ATP-dependent DNA helicase PcrA